MDPAEYAKMYHLEETYWWFQGRKKIVLRMLNSLPRFREGGASVLDLGCGTGLMLDYLSNRHASSIGLDFSPLALQFCRQRGLQRLVRADVQDLPLAADQFDVITALDLAEHVERDEVLFSEIFRALKPGGHLVITVPAHPYLWSEHDEALYHFRRYRRGEFRERILQAGFRLNRLSYCITFTFPPIVAFRWLQRLRPKSQRPKTHLIALPRWANRLILATVEIEALLLKWINLPFGVTLLAVAEKPGAGAGKND
jgi:SAM-dependent methyltransferase